MSFKALLCQLLIDQFISKQYLVLLTKLKSKRCFSNFHLVLEQKIFIKYTI